MSERLHAADAMTLAGAFVTGVGAVNLDKWWGAPVVGLGKVVDLFDGPTSRYFGTEGEGGRILDLEADRVSEAAIVSGLVLHDVVPPYVPLIGYGLKVASQARKGQERTNAGNAAMILKDVAVGAALLSTVFERDTKPHKVLKTSFQVLGGIAIVLGIKEVLTPEK